MIDGIDIKIARNIEVVTGPVRFRYGPTIVSLPCEDCGGRHEFLGEEPARCKWPWTRSPPSWGDQRAYVPPEGDGVLHLPKGWRDRSATPQGYDLIPRDMLWAKAKVWP